MSKEIVIGRDLLKRAIIIYRYEDGGKIYHDLGTDGRVLLTPKLARKLASALERFAIEQEKTQSDDKADVRVVRPVGGSVLGSEEADLVPLPITDDRDTDYVDPKLKEEADLVISGKWDKPLYITKRMGRDLEFNR